MSRISSRLTNFVAVVAVKNLYDNTYDNTKYVIFKGFFRLCCRCCRCFSYKVVKIINIYKKVYIRKLGQLRQHGNIDNIKVMKKMTKRYTVISVPTKDGPTYRIYDRVNQCSIEGGFDTQKWAESVAEMLEQKDREKNNGKLTKQTR